MQCDSISDGAESGVYLRVLYTGQKTLASSEAGRGGGENWMLIWKSRKPPKPGNKGLVHLDEMQMITCRSMCTDKGPAM